MPTRPTLLFLFLFALAAWPAPARESCPEIRSDHPRILFNRDIWPELVRRAEGPAKKDLQALLRKADALPDNTICSGYEPVVRKYGRQEDGTYVSKGSPIKDIKEFGSGAAVCALAWRFTGERRYLEKAKRMLQVSVDAYTQATRNLRPVAWYSTTRINALCAYDWIYEALSPKERREIIVPLIEHVRLIQPEAKLDIPRQPPGSKETGFYGTARLLWFAGLAADGDGFCDEEAHAMLESGYEKYMEVIRYRNWTASDDGGLITQTLDYTVDEYPLSHFIFFYSMISATGRNIADDYPSMALFPYWVWWTWIRDKDRPTGIRHAGTGDSHHDVNFTGGRLMYTHCSNYLHFFSGSNPGAAAFIRGLIPWLPSKTMDNSHYPVMPFLCDAPSTDGAADLEQATLRARHFETTGQVLMRSGWDKDATYCSFQVGGQLNGHRHYDENHFAIYKYDHLALDTGHRGKQTNLNLRYWFAQSVAHNLVLIQKPGELLPPHWGQTTKEPEANLNYGGQTSHTPAKLLAFETNGRFTYLASDASACYGSKARECVRQFVFIYPDWFVVYDRVTSDQPEYEKDWLLHFQNEPSVKGGLVSAESGGGLLFCQTLLPKKRKIDVIGGPGREFWVRDRNFAIDDKVAAQVAETARKRGRGPYTGAWRIELKPSEERADVRFLNVITVGPDSMNKPVKAALVQEKDCDGVRLTIDGKPVTFLFRREGAVGGEVIIDGRRSPLTTGVQAQSGAILQ